MKRLIGGGGTGTPGPAGTVSAAGSGTAGAPGIAFASDPNTGIYNPAADTLAISTGGTGRLFVDSSGRVLAGTSTARSVGNLTGLISAETTGYDGINLISTVNWCQFSFGRIKSGNTAVSNGDTLGQINFCGYDGTTLNSSAANITAAVDGTPGTSDMPGRLVFSTTPDNQSPVTGPVERMRITSAGQVFIGKTADNDNAGITFYTLGSAYIVRDGGSCLALNRLNSDGAIASFGRSTTTVGTISVTTTATAYNTSSDYRLKENVAEVTDGITRLQQLKPSRFNFISNPDKTVDGFIAHEAQTVVPECVTGEKDAVDDDGNPVYQGIDQSKLVPLLTAALQEAVAKIESLEARLTAAGL